MSCDNEVSIDCECDMAVGIGKLCHLKRDAADSDVIVMHNAGSQIFALDLETKNQISETLHVYFWSCIQGEIAKTDRVKFHLGTE